MKRKRSKTRAWDERDTNLGDDAMKLATLVTESAFSSRELAEVSRGLRTFVVVELEDDSPGGFGVNCNVKLSARQR